MQSTIGAVAVMSSATLLSAQPCRWEPLAASLDGFLGRFAVHDHGSGDTLHLAGRGRFSNDVHRWDGRSWVPVGAIHDGVNTIETFDDGSGARLYVGIGFVGKFSPSPLVQVWDGAAWSEVGGGIRTSSVLDGVSDLQPYDHGTGPALYASGTFVGATGTYLSRWSGGLWEPLNGPFPGIMAVFDDGSGAKLYVAGSSPQVWRWDGATWERAFTKDGTISDLEVLDDGSGEALYVAGNFTTIGGIAAGGLAKWDGAVWTALGDVEGVARSLALADDGRGQALFVGGEFTSISGVPAINIARMTPSGFEPLGPGVTGITTAIQGFDDGSGPAVYATGLLIGPTPTPFIDRWTCDSCYPDCDPSTGKNVLDIFDFLCFQDAFVKGDPYACDCDTTTGPGVCDIFDFLCFQDAFAGGCP